jgi:putative flippase GtrA
MNKNIVDLYGIIASIILILIAFTPNVSAQSDALWIGGIVCAIYIAILIIFIMVAIWVYRDAESKGQSGVLWLIVVLVGSIIGLIVYLIVRSGWPDRPPNIGYQCPRCGSQLMFVPQYNRWFCNLCKRYM